jgi:flagellar M-ring protein FliF
MGGTLLKLKAWWETADKTTKTVTFVGGALLTSLLVFVFYFSSSPDMKQLFPPLDPLEQGRIIQKLQELKIPYKQEADGSIQVPSSMIPETRAKLAMQGLPAMGAAGYTRLSEMGFTDPAPLQEEKIRVALEEELAKTILMMGPVAAAKVHINPGNESPFADSRTAPSASVVVQLKPTATSPRTVAEAIVTTIVGAVVGLNPENVSVADTNGMVLYNGSNESDGGSGIASKKREAEIAEAARLKSSIEEMINRVAGPGKAVVSATVEMNFDKEDVSTRSDSTGKSPISSDEVIEEYSNNPQGAGGAATIGAPAAGTATSSSQGGGYKMESRTQNFPTTTEVSNKSVAPGSLISARVSIMLDESAASSAAQIEQFASNLIGANLDPEKFKVSVTSAAFDTSAAESAAKELASAKSGQTLQQIISLIPVLALLFVGFMVVKAIGKASKESGNVLVSAKALTGYSGAIPSSENMGSLPSASQTQSSMQSQKPRGLQEDDLSEHAKQRAAMIKQSFPDVGEIPEKFDENLIRILKMADDRPESVALLVKSWLLEEAR